MVSTKYWIGGRMLIESEARLHVASDLLEWVAETEDSPELDKIISALSDFRLKNKAVLTDREVT